MKIKRTAVFITSLFLFVTGITGSLPEGRLSVQAAERSDGIYVSADGSDENGKGTISSPFATFAKARDAARQSGSGSAVIYVREGTYFFEEPLELTKEDSGLMITSYNGEEVKLSGAVTLTGLHWTDYEKRGGIKTVQLEKGLGIDKIFINGEEQMLCRYPNAVLGEVPLEGAATKAQIKSRAAAYTNPAGGYIRAIHENGWGGNDYIIKGKDEYNELGLDYQWVGDNNRGSEMRDEVVIENVFEELDAPGEWYYDNKDGRLYLWPKEGDNLDKAVVEASVGTEIITVKGEDSSHPVTDITLNGFTYFGTKRTMFTVDEEGKKYIPLMRGDWCVVRAGAVYMENSQNIRIQNSDFMDMGGNGVFMYGYNADHKIDNCEFVNIGSTAIQVVGNSAAAYEASFWEHSLYPGLLVHKTTVDFPDRIGPATEDYPRDIEITNNHIENTGIFEKQSCGVNLSVSSRIKILHNTIHKSARSCINVNDGTFGGHEIAGNDIYNAQLETTDHGPFNSWGRDRFWSVPSYNANGQDGDAIRRYEKDGKFYDIALIDAYQPIKIHDNRFQHNSDAAFTWGIDLDDGSSNYEIYNNLCLGLGIKLREGFNRKVYNNIILDGQIQIHVSYTGARDEIFSNIIANSTPYGFAGVNEDRFKAAEYSVDKNWYYDYGSEISLPEWFHANKASNSYDRNALVDIDPGFRNPRDNDYTVLNEESMEECGFQNFAMDQFGKPGCACQAPVYAKLDSNPGTSDALQREKWKGAMVTAIDNSVISSTASTGYNGIFFESVPKDSEAYAMGFRERDVVKAVNGTELGEKESFFEELEKIPDNALVILNVHRTNRLQTLSFHKIKGDIFDIDCNEASVRYSSEMTENLSGENEWYFDRRQSEDDNSTICAYKDVSGTNTAWFEVEFTGTRIEYVTRKYLDQGDVEMILTNAETGEEVERTTISCADPDRYYQQTVYSSPRLPEGHYKLRGQKKSGTYLIVDMFKVEKTNPDIVTIMTDPAKITYDNGTAVSELRSGENINVEMKFTNNGKKPVKGRVYYLWYDIGFGMELSEASFDSVEMNAGESVDYSGSVKTPVQAENKILQILTLDEENRPLAYSTLVKKPGVLLPSAEADDDILEGELKVRYAGSRHITVMAAGLTENAQTVLRVEKQGELLYMEQKKAEGTKVGFDFVAPLSISGTVTLEITVAYELGGELWEACELNIKADRASLAVKAAQEAAQMSEEAAAAAQEAQKAQEAAEAAADMARKAAAETVKTLGSDSSIAKLAQEAAQKAEAEAENTKTLARTAQEAAQEAAQKAEEAKAAAEAEDIGDAEVKTAQDAREESARARNTAVTASLATEKSADAVKLQADFAETVKHAAEAANDDIEQARLEAKEALLEAERLKKSMESLQENIRFEKSGVKIKRIKRSGKKGCQITWNKVENADGYQIQYALNVGFKRCKTITVSGTGKEKKTVKKWKAGKRYYIRMRAYRQNEGKRIYSQYGAVKKLYVKRK